MADGNVLTYRDGQQPFGVDLSARNGFVAGLS